MSSQAPPIDPRSYDDIIEQTEKLAYQLSGWQPTSRSLVPASPDRLRAEILDEDLSGAATVALRGTPIDDALARRIAAIAQGRTVAIRVWVNPTMAALIGETLDEDVIAPDGTLAAARDQPLDAALVRRVREVRRFGWIRTLAPPDPALLAGLALDEDVALGTLTARRGAMIDGHLAQALQEVQRGVSVRVLAPPTAGALTGLTLRQDVVAVALVAAQDTLLDEDLAAKVAAARPQGAVLVRPLLGAAPAPTQVPANPGALAGMVLAEDVVTTSLVAASGAQLDAALAASVAGLVITGPVRIRREVAADPGLLTGAVPADSSPDATAAPRAELAEDLVDTGVAVARGTLLDGPTARRVAALRLPRSIWVRVQLAPDAVALAFAVLEETVVDGRGVPVGTAGMLVAPELAARIAALQTTPVRVSIPPLADWLAGATLDAPLAIPGAAEPVPAGVQLDAGIAVVVSGWLLGGLPRPTPELAASRAEHGLVWVRPAIPGRLDAGAALIRLFARMMEGSIARLNQAPDKHRLAFLNLLGAGTLPPQPSRAPLTFQLAHGRASAIVPAGTRVAAQGNAAVAFETDADLTLVAARLVAVVAVDPGGDTYGDYTDQATGRRDAPFAAFAGDTAIEHSLYVANDALLGAPGPATTITIASLAGEATLRGASWSYWDGAAWQGLAFAERLSADEYGSQYLTLAVDQLPPLAAAAVDGRSAAWLRARPLPGADLSAAVIRQMRVSVSASAADTPQRLYANGTALDPSKDFYPFGERPRFNDTLYLPIVAGYARPGTAVSIDVTLTNPAGSAEAPIPAVDTQAAVVQWEVYAGGGWVPRRIGFAPFTPGNLLPASPLLSHDDETTRALTTSGTIRITLPPTPLSPVAVGGVTGFWLRARLIAGDYGQEATYTKAATGDDAPDGPARYEYVPATFAPPSIRSLRLSYTFAAEDSFAACLSSSDGVFADHTEEVRSTPLLQIRGGPPDFTVTTVEWWRPSLEPQRPGVRPFARGDAPPALYLGFDRPLPNLPAALFLDVEPNLAGGPAEAADPPAIVWEYATGEGTAGWARLEVDDETRGLTEPGPLRFIGPADAARRTERGQSLYWLRASRGQPGDPEAAGPRLRRVLTNTTWATQATTIAGEVLGSSAGTAGMRFRTSRAPVLLGQRIEVLERDLPAADERAAIVALEGPDAITPVRDAAGHVVGAWVRWHEVSDFYASGPRDRHYLLDHQAGEVRFGDGRAGLIPPVGSGVVRAARYRVGGGAGGNVPAGALTQLAAALPYVAGVTNPVAAIGGVDAESVGRATQRGAAILRHGGRAVAAQDYEDLALGASPEVARALALPAGFASALDWVDSAADAPALAGQPISTGRVGLILVPRSAERRPTPSTALVDRVRAAILACSPPTAHLWIGGPEWDRVTVSAQVAPASFDAAEELERTILRALRAFLHPLTGGRDGRGWPFGRAPYESDIYALIEGIPGVNHIRSLAIAERLEGGGPYRTLAELPGDLRGRYLIYSGDHRVTLLAPGEGD